MASNYSCILLDLDGTLFDFASAEREAVSDTLKSAGLPFEDSVLDLFSNINASMWAALERGEIKKEKLVVQRFKKLLETVNAEGDPIKMNNNFMTKLSESAAVFPGAEELLAELAEFATLAVVSNGIYKVQVSRLEKSGLMKYMDDVFVSEKMGATKPSPKIFINALKKLGVSNKSRVVMVGDSLGADIKGGIAAGIDTCWCNFTGAENTTKIIPTYTVSDYTQLKLAVVGEEALKLAETREKRHII